MQRSIRGNTPTSVGKTGRLPAKLTREAKHPHERGEDGRQLPGAFAFLETPPRAWGRRFRILHTPPDTGNTPTSVGKTASLRTTLTLDWKHPHERGEDLGRDVFTSRRSETPPRAWGRPRRRVLYALQKRNTPTSVGKTRHYRSHSHVIGKHPHERGEDPSI